MHGFFKHDNFVICLCRVGLINGIILVHEKVLITDQDFRGSYDLREEIRKSDVSWI